MVWIDDNAFSDRLPLRHQMPQTGVPQITGVARQVATQIGDRLARCTRDVRGRKGRRIGIASSQIVLTHQLVSSLVSRLGNRLTKFGRRDALLARRLSESYQ